MLLGLLIYLRGQRGLRGPTLKIDFLCFLDTRERKLPAGFYGIKNIVLSQSYDLSKLALRLKNELQNYTSPRFFNELTFDLGLRTFS